MSVKKVVSTEPEWVIQNQRKIRRERSPGVFVSCTLNNGYPTAHWTFNTKEALRFGEKRLVFSDLTNTERIYFKISDKGYKASLQRGAKTTQCGCKFTISKKVVEAYKTLWCGKAYKVHEERGYFYIERTDPLEALFEEPEPTPEEEPEEEPEEITEVTMNRLKKGKGLPKETKQPTKTIAPPENAVFMTPMPESGINDKKVLAVLTRMKEKGFVAMRDLKGMNMNDREYYKAVNDLVAIYGYSIVDIPCIDSTGKRFFVKALYNGTGVWE